MKTFSLFRLFALVALCFAVGHVAYSQPALGNVLTTQVKAVEGEDSSPPAYMLVLAGVSAVLFIGTRRRNKL